MGKYKHTADTWNSLLQAQESVQTAQSLQLAVAGEESEKETHREKVRERQEEKERAMQQLRR